MARNQNNKFSRFKNKRVLILGGMGFIGSNLAIKLVRLGAKVTIVDSMLPQYGGNLENIRSIKNRCNVSFTDIRDRHSMSYLTKNAQVIFSLAGQTSHIDSMKDPFTDLDINCVSQLALLETVRKNNRQAIIVYASTRQIYGKPQYLPADEEHPTIPADINGVNKLAAENYYTLYAKVYGLRCVNLRLTNTYGPRQQLKGNSQGFVGIFLRLALEKKLIKVFGDGKQRRDFNYIDDVVRAFLLAAYNKKLYGGSFNLGGKKNYSLLEFVETLDETIPLNYELSPFPKGHKSIDIGDYYGSFDKFNQLTGWEPKVSLRSGLRRTMEYFSPRKKHYY